MIEPSPIGVPRRARAGEDRRIAALVESHARRRETLAARIEETALDLFRRDGMAVVTVERIAGAAGISRRTFYRYFAGPEEVLLGALCRVMDVWTAALRARPASEPLGESIARTIASFGASIEPTSGPRRLFRILEASPPAWGRIAGRLQQHVAGALREVVAERLRALHRESDCAGAVAAALAVLIMDRVGKAVREERGLQAGEIEAAVAALAALIAPVGR
ncbi:MAG: TetR family transcriptional regulator [Sphingomonadales bacterium]|nr:TetR family transcriptional regulator [Sphingomonadales bacterium]